jgi:hypothetical protein
VLAQGLDPVSQLCLRGGLGSGGANVGAEAADLADGDQVVDCCPFAQISPVGAGGCVEFVACVRKPAVEVVGLDEVPFARSVADVVPVAEQGAAPWIAEVPTMTCSSPNV